MTIELKLLGFSIVLGFVQLMLAAQGSTKQRSLKWNLSARDATVAPLTGIAGRLDRAFKNFQETFVFFLGAVLLVTVLHANTKASALGAQLYFWARVLYVPVYAAGTPVLRTLVWMASGIGILMVLSAVL